MAATGSTTFTTAVRMVDRIHGDTADRRTHTPPSLRAGFAQFAQVVFAMTDLTDGRPTVDVNFSHLAGAQMNRRVCAFPSSQLRRTASGTNQLSPFTRLHFDIVHLRANRNALQWQRITGLDRSILAAHDRCAFDNTLGRQDITPFTVNVLDQRDMRTPIRVILKAFDNARTTTTAIIVSHMVEVTADIINRVAILRRGRICLDQTWDGGPGAQLQQLCDRFSEPDDNS